MELGILALVSGVQRPLGGYLQPQSQSLSGSLGLHVGVWGTKHQACLCSEDAVAEVWRVDSCLRDQGPGGPDCQAGPRLSGGPSLVPRGSQEL